MKTHPGPAPSHFSVCGLAAKMRGSDWAQGNETWQQEEENPASPRRRNESVSEQLWRDPWKAPAAGCVLLG